MWFTRAPIGPVLGGLIAVALLASCSGPEPTTRIIRPAPVPSLTAPVPVPIPSHAPVAPRPRSVGPFLGLGSWVDIYDHASWNHPAATVAAMKAEGIRTIYLQTSNYSRPFDLYRPNQMSIFIDEAHRQGMQVVSWYLPGLVSLTRDVQRSRAAIEFQSDGGDTFDGFGLDIESQELDPPGKRTLALLSLSQQIREAAPSFPLAAVTPSPVALQTPPNGWPDFPWAGLNVYYDVFAPMDYFTSKAHGRAEVQEYVTLSAQIIRGATGDPEVPIAPIGGISQGVSAPEAKGLADAIRREDLIGGSLYDFRTTTDPQVWEALRKIA